MRESINKLFLIIGALVISITQLPGQSVVLDDFAAMRQNGIPGPLWPGMTNQGPTTCSVSNNTLVCRTQGSAPDGLGYWIMTLACDAASCYSNPGSYLKAWIKSGTWNPNINRMRWSYKCSTNIAPSTGVKHWLEIGTYVRSPQDPSPPESGQGQHYYHFLNAGSQANEWVYVELNRSVQHRVGQSGSAEYVEDPEWNSPTMAIPVHYYDGMTHFYFGPTSASELQAAGVTCTTGPYTLDTVSNGADAFVSSVAGTYNPVTGKYEVSWNQPKNIPKGVTFDVRYSTLSMRQNGWNTGINGGSITGPDDSPYTIINYSSPSVARAGAMYFGIRPRMPIVSITRTAPVQVTLSNEGFLSDGDQVIISGVLQSGGGSHPMNGTYTIRNVNRTTISLDGTDGSGWPAVAAYSGTATAASNTKNFAEFVVGTAASNPSTTPCDVNRDGKVDSNDVNISLSSALGTGSCVADLDGNGRCDVVDLQRVINASLSGGSCRTGQ